MMYRCKICSEHYLSTEALQDHQFASHTQEALEAFGITKQSNTKTLSQEWQTRSNENKTEILHSLGYTPSDIQTLISLEFYQFGSKIKKEIGEALTKSTPITQKVQVVESDENKTYQNMYDSYLKSRSAQIKKPFQDGATESKEEEHGFTISGNKARCNTCQWIYDKDEDEEWKGLAEHEQDHKTHGNDFVRMVGESKASEEGFNSWYYSTNWDKNSPQLNIDLKEKTLSYFGLPKAWAYLKWEDIPQQGKDKISSESMGSIFTCPECGFKTVSKDEYDDHSNAHGIGESKASETHIWGAWFSDNFKEEYTMDQDGTYRCKHCNAWFDMYQHSQEVAKYHLAEHGIVIGESKANENKTFTCDKCGKVGDSFSGMAQEECPADSPNNHQIPIFGDQVKPKTVEEAEEDDYEERAEWNWLTNKDQSPEAKATEDDYKYDFDELTSLAQDKIEDEGVTQKEWDETPEEERKDLEDSIGEALKSHTDYHKLINSTLSGETTIQCSKCAKKFKAQESLDIHYNDTHADSELKSLIGELKASEIGYNPSTGVTTSIHGGTWDTDEEEAIARAELNPTNKCGMCNKTFDSVQELKDHIRASGVHYPTGYPTGESKANEEIEYTGGDFCDKCGTEFEDKGECKKCSEESMVEDIIHKTDSGVDITHSQDEWCELCEQPTTSFEMSDDEYEEEVEDLMEEEGIDEITDLDEEEKKDFFEDVDDIKVTDEEESDENMTEEEELQQARENLAPLDKNQDEKSNVTKAFESGASVEDIYSKVGDTTQDRGSEDDLTDIYNKVDVKLNLEKY